MTQCRYRHCRRFVRPSTEYCSGFRLCQIDQEHRDAMSAGLILAIQQFVRERHPNEHGA